MAKCVEITLQDDGTLTVKECPPKEEAMEPDDGYQAQQADNMEDAFSIASEILGQSDQAAQEDQGFNSVFQQQEMGA